MKVVYRKTAELIPYANNSRTHGEAQVTQIASSIREFGFNVPVLVDAESGIIAGHGRLLAAQKLGLETVPTIQMSHLSKAQKRAYILADNRIALNAGWDDEMLEVELRGLDDDGIDLDLLGFSSAELQRLLDLPDEGEQDEPGDGAYKEQYGVIVMCGGESEQERVFNQLQAEGYKCRVVTT